MCPQLGFNPSIETLFDILGCYFAFIIFEGGGFKSLAGVRIRLLV